MVTDVLILRDEPDSRRVKAGRYLKGWSQTALATHAGVAVRWVSYLERGFKIPTSRRRAIFEALGLDAGNE